MMTRSPAVRKLVFIAVIIALLGVMYPLQGVIEETRFKAGLANTNSLKDVPPGEFFGTVLIGGFRAIAVDLIWLKAHDAERNREWHRLKILNSLIASLQPRFVEVWKFNMWNMAYNLSNTAPSDREGWRWVKEGLRFGKEGFERNPDSWLLAWDIGHHYYHRCGDIRDNRTDYYQQQLFEETGKTNWQHALKWFKKACEIADKLDVEVAKKLIRNLRSDDIKAVVSDLTIEDGQVKDVAWSDDFQNYLVSNVQQRLGRKLTDQETRDLESFATKLVENPDRANPNWLAMIAATYRKIAYEAEAKGDDNAMVENRVAAIKWLKKLKTEYPGKESFVRYATGEAAEIAGRLQCHQIEDQAEVARKEGDTAKEMTLLNQAALFWMKLYEGNPYIDEQIRHLKMIAGRMKTIASEKDGELRNRAEALELDIWLTLLSGPDAVDEYIQKCEELNDNYTKRLDQAIASKDIPQTLANLEPVLSLRREIYAKDPLSDKYVESMHDAAMRCEQVVDMLPDVPREQVAMWTRNAWLDLLEFGHKDAAEPGLSRLKDFAEVTTEKIAGSSDEKSEALRQKVVVILSDFYMQDIQRDWAEKLLRKIGSYYTQALTTAVANKQNSVTSDYYRRSKAIWKRILQLNPDDNQAKDNLNRIEETITIVLQKNSLGM